MTKHDLTQPEGGRDPIDVLFERFGPTYRWLATVSVMMGTISAILTATIVNVALPDIMGAFGMDQNTAQLLSTGFLAATTGTMLLNAWMVDTVGQRLTYLFALVLFICASVMGGLAPGQGILILARVLQGAAAGIIQPLAMQVIFQVFPVEKRGSAMGIYGIGVVLAPAIGPTLGGIMVDSFSWRYVFFMAVPFCMAGLTMGAVFLPGRRTKGPIRRFDVVGMAMLSLFLVTLLTGLSNGQRDGWMSDRIVTFFTVALVSGLIFVVWEMRTSTPLLNMKVFTNRVFVGASLVTFVYGAGLYGSTYLIPLFVQTMQGYTPTRSGFLLMPAGLVLGVVFPLAGRMSDKTPAYISVLMGLGLFAFSSFLLAGVDVNTGFWIFAFWIVLGRIGLGIMMPGLNAGALRALPPEMIGQGSGAINFIRQFGGAIGVNVLSVFLQMRTQFYGDTFTAAQTSANSATNEMVRAFLVLLKQVGLHGPEDTVLKGSALHYLGQMVYAQGHILGYRDSFFLVGLIFAAGLLPALMMRNKRKAGGPGKAASPKAPQPSPSPAPTTGGPVSLAKPEPA